jgi:hypothetical protein
MGRALLIGWLAALGGVGCLPTPTFTCAESSECGSGGTCQPDGLCSFTDTSCATNQRYGSLAGNDSNQCVAELGSGSGSGSGSACTGFSALKDGNTHDLFLPLQTPLGWESAVSECSTLGGYLAVPTTQQEVNGILDMTCANTWMGIHEVGSAFDTPTGSPVSFLPWDCNQPMGSGEISCVSAVEADDAYALADCASPEAVMCECNP